MPTLLDPATSDILGEYARSSLLVALDYDGTLAPIVSEPSEAWMRPETKALLQRVTAAYPTIVVSGRGQEDVEQRVSGLGLAKVIGNHGMDPLRRMEEFALQVKMWKPVVERGLLAHPGVELEDKHYSLAIHYRHSPHRQLERAEILKVVHGLTGVRMIPGHKVVNLLPEGAPHKGMAVLDALERMACERGLYVGDDEADEDVFTLHTTHPLLTVRVGHDASSHAKYFLESQRSVDALLSRLGAERGGVRNGHF